MVILMVAALSDPEEIRAFFARSGKKVITFAGYSGAGYEDPERMLAEAGKVLDEHDASATIVNLGATAVGIGAVYDLARERGFATTGIVSTRARESGATISPSVDHVFFVEDDTWGGLDESTGELSPTSRAMVGVSDLFVSIGGGEVARDELAAARRLGKAVRFIPAARDQRKASR